MSTVEIFMWITNAVTIAGMILIARRNALGWGFYIVASVWYILIFISLGSVPQIFLWSVFLVGNIYGLMNWSKAEEKETHLVYLADNNPVCDWEKMEIRIPLDEKYRNNKNLSAIVLSKEEYWIQLAQIDLAQLIVDNKKSSYAQKRDVPDGSIEVETRLVLNGLWLLEIANLIKTIKESEK